LFTIIFNHFCIIISSSNLVPFCVTKKGVILREDGKLSNIAPTILALLGANAPKEMDEPSMIL
jgi:2,3-bisphosphoglycerate-independent phosphoglycerate mutase